MPAHIFVAITLFCAIALAWSEKAPAAEVPAGGRAWELVTPSAPVNSLVVGMRKVSDDGRRIVYQAAGTMPGGPAGDLISHGFATRTDSGWAIEPIGGAYEISRFDFATFFGPSVPVISRDFSSVVISFGAPMLPSAPPGPRIGVYRWSEDDSLSFAADLGLEGSVVDASDDLSRIVATTPAHILPSDAGRSTGASVYMVDGSTITQADVDTAGALLSACGSSVSADGVSDSGDRVYFVNPAESGACGMSRVFLKESDGTTTEVSASRCSGADCDGAKAAAFTGATPDGSVAFFISAQRLTNADENSGRDLYRFDAETDALELVSPGSATTPGEVTADPVLTTADGSVTYFYAQGRLIPDVGPIGFASGLYVADQDGIRFVAAVPSADPIEISSDGKLAAFSTAAALDTSDTDGRTDTYVYDDDKRSLTLVSHGPTGGNGAFDATIASSVEAVFAVAVRNPFANDGSRVFFETAEALIPEDQNNVLDVYEWQAGELGLISSGKSPYPSRFGGAGSNGETAVIMTAESLLPRDLDAGDLDLYAARPGGGFPEEEQAASPACEDCPPPDRGRAVRPVAASAAVKPEKIGRIRLRPLAEGACRNLLQTGRLTMTVTVPAPGRVSARATGRVGGKPRTLLRGVAGAVEPGPLTVRLGATDAARAELRRDHRLRVRLTLEQASSKLVRSITLGCGGRG